MPAITFEIIKEKFPIGALVQDNWGDQHVIKDYDEANWRFDIDGDIFYYPNGKENRHKSLLIHRYYSYGAVFAIVLKYPSNENFFLTYFPFNL